MELNTLFQLYALAKNQPDLLERVETLLLTPDLFGYFLTGKKAAEYSIASTAPADRSADEKLELRLA